jgi:hypothetical protein
MLGCADVKGRRDAGKRSSSRAVRKKQSLIIIQKGGATLAVRKRSSSPAGKKKQRGRSIESKPRRLPSDEAVPDVSSSRSPVGNSVGPRGLTVLDA